MQLKVGLLLPLLFFGLTGAYYSDHELYERDAALWDDEAIYARDANPYYGKVPLYPRNNGPNSSKKPVCPNRNCSHYGSECKGTSSNGRSVVCDFCTTNGAATKCH
ncbi:hypothetical protein MMC13_003347 [Lambiella insularis]|nr:hypothetical protein [Lambiella insularis]